MPYLASLYLQQIMEKLWNFEEEVWQQTAYHFQTHGVLAERQCCHIRQSSVRS